MDIRTRNRLSMTAWGVGAFVAVFWSFYDRTTVQAHGMGYAPRVIISSEDGGRLARIDVTLHAHVRAGDVVARLDSQAVSAEREIMSAELLAAQEGEAIRVATAANALARDLEGGLLERARIASALQEDRAARVGIAQRILVERDLAGRGASSQEQVALLEQALAVLDAGIVTRERALELSSEVADAARGQHGSTALSNPWAVVAAARRLEAADQQMARLDLLAQMDGQVTWIWRSPGEFVAPGDPILEIAPPETSEVVAWVDPGEASRLQIGEGAVVVRADGAELSGTLESLGGSLREMPGTLWSNPQWPQYGVPIRIRLSEGVVAPDEPLVVRL